MMSACCAGTRGRELPRITITILLFRLSSVNALFGEQGFRSGEVAAVAAAQKTRCCGRLETARSVRARCAVDEAHSVQKALLIVSPVDKGTFNISIIDCGASNPAFFRQRGRERVTETGLLNLAPSRDRARVHPNSGFETRAVAPSALIIAKRVL